MKYIYKAKLPTRKYLSRLYVGSGTVCTYYIGHNIIHFKNQLHIKYLHSNIKEMYFNKLQSFIYIFIRLYMLPLLTVHRNMNHTNSFSNYKSTKNQCAYIFSIFELRTRSFFESGKKFVVRSSARVSRIKNGSAKCFLRL